MTTAVSTVHRLRAADVMRAPVVTVCPIVSAWESWPDVSQRYVRADADMGEVAQVIVRDRVHAVPVVDARGRLVGVVTTADLTRAVARYGIVQDTIDACD